MKIQIVEIKAPVYIKCSLHGKQKLIQCTEYGSSECEKCVKDMIKFFKNKKSKK